MTGPLSFHRPNAAGESLGGTGPSAGSAAGAIDPSAADLASMSGAGGAAGAETPSAPVKPATVNETPLDFAAVVARFEGPLLRYARQIVRQEADAQDVVQEAFLRLHRQVQQHGQASIQSMNAWLSRVTHNLAMDLLRKRNLDAALQQNVAQDAPRPTAASPADDPANPGNLETREAAEIALAELNRLPAEQKQVILLRLIQGLKLAEISEVTGLSTGNVDYRVNQGLRELAKRLKNAGVI